MIRKIYRSLFIQANPTPNANAIKFIPGRSVLGSTNKTLEFASKDQCSSSPLAHTLFQLSGVSSVLLGKDFITITKAADSEWKHIKPDVYSAIMDFYSLGVPAVNQDLPEADIFQHSDDSTDVVMIKELLESRIRPTIQEDGGDVHFVKFENGTVHLKLSGACRTCDSSVITLKNGIEGMLKHYIPAVQSVEQVLDEAEKESLKEFTKLEEKLKQKD